MATSFMGLEPDASGKELECGSFEPGSFRSRSEEGLQGVRCSFYVAKGAEVHLNFCELQLELRGNGA